MLCGLAAPVGPLVEMRQLHAQDRRLELVQARVVADLLVVDLVARAVEAQDARLFGDPLVGGDDHAAVAEAAEVLGREERERRGGSERARATGAREPAAWAASSSTGTPSASISATGATLPNRCTAITAFVRG